MIHKNAGFLHVSSDKGRLIIDEQPCQHEHSVMVVPSAQTVRRPEFCLLAGSVGTNRAGLYQAHKGARRKPEKF
jgi:hypothetical protein